MKKKKVQILCLLILLSVINISCNKVTPGAQNKTSVPTVIYTDAVPPLDITPMNFGFVATESKLISLEKWQHLADYLTAKTGLPLEVKIFNNDSELLDTFPQGSTDIAFLDGLAYVRATEETKVIPILRSIEDGSPFTKSYIIVRKDSGIKKISELKHRKFSFTDKISAGGYLFPRVMLAKEGIKDINGYFSKINFTGDDFSSFLSVYNGYVDGGVISQAIMEKEDERFKDIEIIGETESIPLKTIIVKPDLDKEYVEKLKHAFLEIGKTIDTRDLTKIIKIDGYVEANDSDYDGIRDNLKILKEIEKK